MDSLVGRTGVVQRTSSAVGHPRLCEPSEALLRMSRFGSCQVELRKWNHGKWLSKKCLVAGVGSGSGILVCIGTHRRGESGRQWTFDNTLAASVNSPAQDGRWWARRARRPSGGAPGNGYAISLNGTSQAMTVPDTVPLSVTAT